MAAAFLVREKEVSLREDALFCSDAVGQIFKLQFIGLTPDKLQVKHSRWSCEARYSA